MEGLTRSSTKIFTNENGNKAFSFSRTLVINKSELSFFRSSHLGGFSLISLKPKTIQWVASSKLSSETEVWTGLETPATEIQSIQPSKTVHVKFQLQKECLFGEHFFLVGDDPMIGFWNPSNAIPMNWSDGHLWTVELDIHVERSIRFKYILRRSNGDILWQPGPNRIFRAWETEKTITIAEDWENFELQKVTEDPNKEYLLINLENEVVCNINNENMMLLDDIARSEDETTGERNKEIFTHAEKIIVSEEESESLELNNIRDKSVGIWKGGNENSRISVEEEEGVFGYEECHVLVPGLMTDI